MDHPKYKKILVSPEPKTKRTVDGDLGIYLNAPHVIDLIGKENIKNLFSNYDELLKNLTPFPKNNLEEEFSAFFSKILSFNCYQEACR